MLRPERLGSRVRGERSWLQPHPVRLTTPVSLERPTLRAEPSPGLDCAERTLLQQPRLPGLASPPTRRRAEMCLRGREKEAESASKPKEETCCRVAAGGALDSVASPASYHFNSPPPGAHPGGPSGGDSRSPALVSPPPQLL